MKFPNLCRPLCALVLLMFVGCATHYAAYDSPATHSTREKTASAKTNGTFKALLPHDQTSPIVGRDLEFRWTRLAEAILYRLEIEETYGNSVFKTILPENVESYRMPASQGYNSKDLRWRVSALDRAGNMIAETPWRILLAPSSECED